MNHLFFISVVFLHSLINQSDYDAMFFFLQNAKLKQIISYFVNQLIFFGRAQTRTSGGDGEVTANNFIFMIIVRYDTEVPKLKKK